MNRRVFVGGVAAALWMGRQAAWAASSNGQKLADAARLQVGVTTGYDPNWKAIAYPGGDVPRSTGVCADVVIRAARDALGLDLQKLVHEDMVKHFDEYPARKAWGSKRPDANIDHRRVLNLETYWTRAEARLWAANGPVAGDGFPKTLEVGDILSWLLFAKLPHVGIVASIGRAPCTVVHNIGRGVEEWPLISFHDQRAAAHYRWPVNT
jgi:hypothetical protein